MVRATLNLEKLEASEIVERA